jgi:hypothetical protein
MSQKILVANYRYHVSRDEFEKMALQVAPAFSDVPGCLWKIWLIDADKKEAGGIYLFADEQSLQNFKMGPLVASLLADPALSDFDFKEKDVLQQASELTHAPLMAAGMEHQYDADDGLSVF